MTPVERRVFGLLCLLVVLTGTAYGWMKYVVVNPDPLAVVNHPWQGAMQATHVLAGPAILLMFGVLLRSHILKKIAQARVRKRLSGFTSLATFAVMAVSGYALQVVTHEAALRALVIIHVASGAVFAVAYLAHLVALVPARRRRADIREAA